MGTEPSERPSAERNANGATEGTNGAMNAGKSENVIVFEGPAAKADSKPKAEPQLPESHKPLTWPARIFILAVLLLLLSFDFFFRTMAALVATVVAVIPVAIAAFIIVRLSDHTLPKSFLVEQMFWGAVPGYIIAMTTQSMLMLLLLGAFFPDVMRRIHEAVQSNKVSVVQIIVFELHSLPLWKLLLFAVTLAFAVVTVHQTLTLAIGQRTRDLMSGGSHDVDLSAYSMAGGVAGGALGFVGMNQFVIIFNAVTVLMTKKFDILPALVSSLSAVLELSVQVATAFLIGCAMARKFVVREKVRVFVWFFVAVLLHGILYAITFSLAMLRIKHIVPIWALFAVPATELVVFLILGLLVRKSYKALERSNYALVESGSNA